MTRRVITAAALVLGAFAVDPAWPAKCLDEPGDAAQVAAARTAIEAACKCFGVASRGEYVRCVSAIVNDRANQMLLRAECTATLKSIYKTSVCGRDIERAGNLGPTVACVVENFDRHTIRCKMKPFYACRFSNDRIQFDQCSSHTHCLDAADSDGDLEIAFPGDTGDCVGHPDTLEDNGDGTISDSRTNLMWEKLSDDGSIHDWDDLYAWDDASAKIAVLNSGGGFAGYTDWRLPTIHELMTLFRTNSPPTVPPELDTGCAPGCTVLTCSCTAADGYGSATAGPRGTPWRAFFSAAFVKAVVPPEALPVRAVRAGS